MGDHFGYDLTGVPRNANTENLFRTAAKQGDPDFLSWDEIEAEPMMMVIAQYRCRETEDMRVLHYCMAGIERYVLENGFQKAMKHYSFNSDSRDLSYYVLAKTACNGASRFAVDAQEIIAKYRPSCRRLEKPLPDVLANGKPTKAAEIRDICATPTDSVKKTESCADYLAQKFAAENKGYQVASQSLSTFSPDISDDACLAL